MNDYNLDGNQFTYSWTIEKRKSVKEGLSISEVLDAYDLYANGDQSALENVVPFESQVTTENEDGSENTSYLDQLGDLTLRIAFNTSYVEFKRFLMAVETGQHTAIVKRVSMNKQPETLSSVSGQIEIAFPYYNDGEALKELEWDLIENEYGRYDPFLAKVRNQIITQKENVHDPTTVDFMMFLESHVADGPTVGFQKHGLRQSSLYADKNEPMPLRLDIEKAETGYQLGILSELKIIQRW